MQREEGRCRSDPDQRHVKAAAADLTSYHNRAKSAKNSMIGIGSVMARVAGQQMATVTARERNKGAKANGG